MNHAEQARDILDTLLGQVGFHARLDIESQPTGDVLQVTLEHAEALIGKRAERLEDLQYLVSRLLLAKSPEAPKIRVDVAHVREMQEDAMLDEVRAAADRVRASRHAIQLPPMNSFHRRMVHELFLNDPQIKTWAPEEQSRMKRITLIPR